MKNTFELDFLYSLYQNERDRKRGAPMINQKIHYFLTLAECLSFTQTAVRYDVSQTAISQYISSLEERLGVRLFERGRHSVALTEAGRYYYSRVSLILKTYEDTIANLQTIDKGYRGYLKIGVGMYEYCSTETLFSRFLTEHPEVKIDILQYPYSTLTEKLRLGELDIIICDELCEKAFSRKELRAKNLFSSPNMIAAAPETAEAYHGDVSAMVRKECMITNCESGGPSSLAMFRRLLMDEFGFVSDNIAQTNSVNAQLMMVRARHGIAMVPGFILEAQAPDLKSFSLPSRHPIRYKMLCLKESHNEAVPLLFNFSAD